MISRRCASTSTPFRAATARLDDGAGDHGLADPVGATRMMRRSPAAMDAIKLIDDVVLIGAQLGHAHEAPDRPRGCCDSGTAAAGDGALDAGRAIVRIGHQPVGERRLDQPVENFGFVKFAAGDQLEQRERCAIERVIARSLAGCWRVRISRIRARPCRRRRGDPLGCSGARMVATARSDIVGRLRVSATSQAGAVAIGTSLPQR